MPPTPNRRKRPHPAGGARRWAGWLSVAALFGLTGGMAVVSRIPTTTTSATTQAGVNTLPAASSDDGALPSRRATSATAVAGSTSSPAVTVTRAS